MATLAICNSHTDWQAAPAGDEDQDLAKTVSILLHNPQTINTESRMVAAGSGLA